MFALTISKDWALGDIPNDQFFHAAIRLSQTSGDLIVSIDAPFRDDPKPATFQTTSQDDIPSELSFQKFGMSTVVAQTFLFLY